MPQTELSLAMTLLQSTSFWLVVSGLAFRVVPNETQVERCHGEL